MKPKNTNQIIDQKREVRVLGNTRHPDDQEKNAMVGGIFEVKAEYYYYDIVCIWNEDKTDWWWFNRKDLQFLTPLSYKGRRIGLRDKVKYGDEWYVVVSWCWDAHYEEWALECYKEDLSDWRTLLESEIKDIIPYGEEKSTCNPCFDSDHKGCVDKRCECSCKQSLDGKTACIEGKKYKLKEI